MKRQVKALAVACAIVLSACFTTSAIAATTTAEQKGFRVAIVDVNAVVAKSKQVQDLKKEQETKVKELQTWLTTVKADIDKQKTQEGKDKLLQKYNAEFTKKQDAIKENYAKKLQAIDKSISATIAEEAKVRNYDMVFAKGTVLYGGDDLTNAISKAVK